MKKKTELAILESELEAKRCITTIDSDEELTEAGRDWLVSKIENIVKEYEFLWDGVNDGIID